MNRGFSLKCTILSMSILTVMAGAIMSPEVKTIFQGE